MAGSKVTCSAAAQEATATTTTQAAINQPQPHLP